MASRRYLLGTTRNMRDLGGYPARGGKTTQFGRLIRSDVPLSLSRKDKRLLLDQRISTVLDLREPKERERVRSSLERARGFSVHHRPLASFMARIPAQEGRVPISYLRLVDEKTALTAAFQCLAAAEEGVLFHCTAGKDRTGVISALLLGFVGVSLDDILADYQISYTYNRDFVRRLRAAHPEWPSHAGQSKMEYMEQFYEMFLHKYGSEVEYFSQIGLTSQEIQRLYDKLID